MRTYREIKNELRVWAKTSKRHHKTDKPAIRQDINDILNDLCFEINRMVMKEQISESKGNQYKNWLGNYACNLHPKD